MINGTIRYKVNNYYCNIIYVFFNFLLKIFLIKLYINKYINNAIKLLTYTRHISNDGNFFVFRMMRVFWIYNFILFLYYNLYKIYFFIKDLQLNIADIM